MTPVTEATPVTKLPAVKFTERINRIEPSATMAVVAEADKLRQQGIDVVDFGAGEPHFSTPQHIKDAAISAIQNNFSKYTAVGGTPELRDAIVRRHGADFQSDYRREECVASVGGKHALFNAIQVLVDHGDEVILPVPYWVSFKDIVRYAGGNCVLLQADESSGLPRYRRHDRAPGDAAHQNDHSEFTLESFGRGDVSGRFEGGGETGGGARHLGVVRRMLCLSELHRRELFRRIAARLSRAHDHRGFAVQDLCHDRDGVSVTRWRRLPWWRRCRNCRASPPRIRRPSCRRPRWRR